MPSEITNPRRILAVALAESQDHLTRVVGDLTGAYPSGALAGTTHELALTTPYYRAQVPVWLDLVGGGGGESDDDVDGDPENAPEQWADAFLGDEAREVREVLGGVVAVVDVEGSAASAEEARRRQHELVDHVGRLVRGLGAVAKDDDGDDDSDDDYREPWDGVALVVGVAQAPVDDDTQLAWDDHCVAAGLEFVLVAPGQADTNTWGEKTGTARVLEALQANDWAAAAAAAAANHDPFGAFQDPATAGADGDDDGNVDDPESLDFGFDRADFEGLRQAIWQQQTRETGDGDNGDDDDDDDDNDHAEAMQRLIGKLQAARMQGELLPPAQRRAMAARVVGEVMDEI